MEIIPYQQIYRIECFDESVYFIPEKTFSSVKKIMNEIKFLEIGNKLIAVSSIKSVTPDKNGMGYVPEEYRDGVNIIIAQFKKDFGRVPRTGEIGSIIQKVKREMGAL